MEGTEFRDDAKQIYFGTWFYEFDFPIGLLGEKILKVHVNGYKQIKLGITYVFPVQSKDDESWKNLD